jgi:glutamyl/glutaminyl-tRNA synthetase
LQQIKQTIKKPINYFKENSQKFTEAELSVSVENALKDSRKPVLMYRLQRNEVIVCKDELLGETKFDLSLEEDFGILKSDGFPTYHLAHLVDDHEMKTSLVIRSQEWFPSIPKHVAMFTDFFGTPLKYMHIPFILGETGNKKMSKRDGNVNAQDYLDKGFLPEAIINYLAFLGWNPGTEKELYLEKSDF